MQELIKMVSERAGISDEKAKAAVEVVMTQLKAKLPGPLAGQVESALAGQAAGAAGIGAKLGL
jgi:uncharacterized protein (DUF2267 family)